MLLDKELPPPPPGLGVAKVFNPERGEYIGPNGESLNPETRKTELDEQIAALQAQRAIFETPAITTGHILPLSNDVTDVMSDDEVVTDMVGDKYDGMHGNDVKALVKERGLTPASWKKDDLLAALRASDAKGE